MNDVMLVVRQFGCEIVRQESQLFCELEIAVPGRRVTEMEYKVKELRSVEMKQIG